MVDDWRVLTFAVVGKVAAGAVQIQLANVRREHLVVALLTQRLADECLQLLANHGAVWFPQHKTLSNHFIDVKKLQLLSNHAVVAQFGFLKLLHVRVKFSL